ncbi:MAG: plastocyanin/azurin family copper-binding protein [Panacibacter sp.]
MKKFTIIIAVMLCSYYAAVANIIRIRVSDFQFQPKNAHAMVGDTIVWLWKTGSHTTTSVNIPVGATPWDSPMNSGNKRFGIIVTIPGRYDYHCIPHASVMMARITVSPALEAGLNDFSVSGDNLNALLSWKTDSEKSIAYFSVQRSGDGENFREIKRVFPSPSNAYNFTDNTATGKYVYYQVKMVDIKGNEQLTDIQINTRNITLDKLVTSLSPNPISKPGHLMMQFNSDIEGIMRIQLYAQNGKLVKEQSMSASKGVNNGHFHMGELPSGSYYIVCTLGTRTEKYTVIMK